MTAFTLIMSFLLVGAFADQMQDTCPSKSGTAGEVSTIGGPLVEQEEALADDVHEQAYESPSTLEHVLMVQYFATKLDSTRGKNDLPEKNDQSNELSLQVTEHTIQQKSTMHYLDAWQDSWHDYDAVMRQAQGDDSQKWLVTKVGENEYTIQQKATMHYLDAWEDWGHDYRAAMRQAQGDDSQKWIITQAGANEECSIKQKSTMRAMDAHESGHDYSAVTREEKGDDTQLWIFDPPLTFPTPEPTPVPTPAATPVPTKACPQRGVAPSPCLNQLTGMKAKGCRSDSMDCTVTDAYECKRLCDANSGCNSFAMWTPQGCQLCGKDGESVNPNSQANVYSKTCAATLTE